MVLRITRQFACFIIFLSMIQASVWCRCHSLWEITTCRSLRRLLYHFGTDRLSMRMGRGRPCMDGRTSELSEHGEHTGIGIMGVTAAGIRQQKHPRSSYLHGG